MVGSMRGRKTIARTATIYSKDRRFRQSVIIAGPQSLNLLFEKTCACKIGYAGAQCHQDYNYQTLFFVFPKTKSDNNDVQRYPRSRIPQYRHQPIEKWVGHIVIAEIK